MKVVSLITMTDEGRTTQAEAAQVFAKSVEIVESAGGKLLEAWAVDGRCDFVSVTDYPSEEAVFEAKVKLLELGKYTAENLRAFDMDIYFSKV